jgi:hypothetical protein
VVFLAETLSDEVILCDDLVQAVVPLLLVVFTFADSYSHCVFCIEFWSIYSYSSILLTYENHDSTSSSTSHIPSRKTNHGISLYYISRTRALIEAGILKLELSRSRENLRTVSVIPCYYYPLNVCLTAPSSLAVSCVCGLWVVGPSSSWTGFRTGNPLLRKAVSRLLSSFLGCLLSFYRFQQQLIQSNLRIQSVQFDLILLRLDYDR